MARSKAARKIFPFLSAFRSQARSAVENSEVPLSINVATTLERLNSEEEGTCSDGSVASTSTSTQEATHSAPVISSTPRAVTIARVTTVPNATNVAVIAAAPKVASESIQVTAGTSRLPSITLGEFSIVSHKFRLCSIGDQLSMKFFGFQYKYLLIFILQIFSKFNT